jgi:N-alpha-acetyltransferase 30
MSQSILKDIEITRFKDETQLEDIIGLISNDLSEPYSIYVYRYFIQQWYPGVFFKVI